MTAIRLRRVIDNQNVDAVLARLTPKNLDDVEALWKPRLQPSQEEDSHWDWVEKNRLISSSLNYERYAIECEHITQGLMILETDWHFSRLEPQKNIMYVDFLSTAPWNRPSIEKPPKYRGVGTALLNFARTRSVESEYCGRVALHALPSAEKFYQKQGMINLGVDSTKENLTYFEWKHIET